MFNRKRSYLSVCMTICVLLFSGCLNSNSTSNSTPDSEGAYQVGSTTIFIHDYTRGLDSVSGIDDGVRTLVTEIWYPVLLEDIDSSDARPTYGDYSFGNKYIHTLMMYDTTFFHAMAYDFYSGQPSTQEGVTQQDLDEAADSLFNLERNSYKDAPIADTGTPFPVVIMSHGDAGSRYNMETACEYMAANGYIVIAPEHTGNTPYSVIGKDPALDAETGDEDFLAAMADVMGLIDVHGVYETDDAQFGQTYAAFDGALNPDYSANPEGLLKMDQSLVERVNDLRATINKLDELNVSGFFADKIDTETIGLMGRSFGGATTLAGLELVDRIMAGAAVVPLATPDIRPYYVTQGGQLQNGESTFLSSDMENKPALSSLNKPTLLLNCAEDSTIIPLGNIFAMWTGDTTLTPNIDNPFPSSYRAFEETNAPVVWAVLADSNHGSYAISSPYWWPDLKRNTFSEVFNSEQEYTLIDSEKAHEIQKKKILAFFDYFLKADEAAKERLLSDEFVSDGLSLEHRNLD